MKSVYRRLFRNAVPIVFVMSALLFAGSLLFAGGGRESSNGGPDRASAPDSSAAEAAVNPPLDVDYLTEESALKDGLVAATFAGGCFWCMEGPYDKLEGVVSTTSGYAGGHVINPRYEEVVSGTTGHTEVVQVVYNPKIISYEELLEVFWVNIDPIDAGGQFCDRGTQYRSEIFYHTDEQRGAALASRQRLDGSGVLPRPVVTGVTALDVFYPAEQYHQDYYLNNPLRYLFYRTSCGRDARLAHLWGPADQ